MFPHIIEKNRITVIIDGIPRIVNDNHPNFNSVKKGIKDNNETLIRFRCTPKEMYERFFEGTNFGQLTMDIDTGHLLWNGSKLKEALEQKLLDAMVEGKESSTVGSEIIFEILSNSGLAPN